MNNNLSENVISLSSDSSTVVGAHDDPIHELLNEFEEVSAPAVPNLDDNIPFDSSAPDLMAMSEEMLLDYIRYKIDTIRENTKRIDYLSSEIELHYNV